MWWPHDPILAAFGASDTLSPGLVYTTPLGAVDHLQSTLWTLCSVYCVTLHMCSLYSVTLHMCSGCSVSVHMCNVYDMTVHVFSVYDMRVDVSIM